MNWLALAALLYLVAFFLLMRHYDRRARQREAAWDALPSLYTLEELQAWYEEHRELEEAGLLDPDQPTPWSHALHRAARYGSVKDKVHLRMVVDPLVLR